MTIIPETAKAITASGLTVVAKVLRLSADTVGGIAALLQPGAEPAEHRPRPGGADEQTQQPQTRAAGNGGAAVDTPGTVKERTHVDVPDVARAATTPSRAADHAQGTVADVVGRIPDLSTDELRLLLEHESTHKQRKGVLEAIEDSLTPQS